MDQVKVAFEPTIRLLALDQILPSKMLSASVIESAKYNRASGA